MKVMFFKLNMTKPRLFFQLKLASAAIWLEQDPSFGVFSRYQRRWSFLRRHPQISICSAIHFFAALFIAFPPSSRLASSCTPSNTEFWIKEEIHCWTFVNFYKILPSLPAQFRMYVTGYTPGILWGYTLITAAESMQISTWTKRSSPTVYHLLTLSAAAVWESLLHAVTRMSFSQ